MAATSIGPTQSYLYINSFDRYPNSLVPRTLSNQTTSADITYPVPGLANLSTVSLIQYQTTSQPGQFNNAGLSVPRPETYTNLINMVDYTTGVTTLVTLPITGSDLPGIIALLGRFINATTYGGSSVANPAIVCAVGTGTTSGTLPIYNPISALASNTYWNWYDAGNSAGTSHSIGWAPVTVAPDGTNISTRRQLYDLLGLDGHVPSVAGLGQPGAGYSIQPIQTTWGMWKYYDVVCPQLSNLSPDLNTGSGSNIPPNVIQRVFAQNLLTSILPVNSVLAKVFKVVPGSKSLQIKLLDDKGDLIPLNWAVPAPFSGVQTTGVGIQNTTTSNLTFSGISNANTRFSNGQIVQFTTTTPPTGWFPTSNAYQIQSTTSNTISIYYKCPAINTISNATTTFTVFPAWRTDSSGNMSGIEYQMAFAGTALVTS